MKLQGNQQGTTKTHMFDVTYKQLVKALVPDMSDELVNRARVFLVEKKDSIYVSITVPD